MTGPTGLLNFFVLEASEYVEQLDTLLGAAGPAGPDADAFTRAARALRGSATMAKLSGISALAAGTERIGRALRERALPWTPALRGALVATVDDLRMLVRGARTWGEAEERRAQTRTAELLGFVPPAARAASPTPISTATGALFVVSGATDVAAALTAAVSRPANPELLAEALRRLRGLRGVATIRDYPPLPDLLDGIERVARPIAARTAPAPAEELAALSTGARWLRRAAEEVRAGRRPDERSPEAAAFQEALARAEAARTARDRVVPVRELFHDDAGPHIVQPAPQQPATTAEERFRMEAAGTAEHVRRLVADARAGARSDGQGAVDGATVAGAVESLVGLVRSFDYGDLADALVQTTAGVATLDPLALSAADASAAMLLGRRRSVADVVPRMRDLSGARVVGTLVNVGYAPVSTPSDQPAGLGALGITATPSRPQMVPSRPTPTPRETPVSPLVPFATPEPAPEAAAPEPTVPEPTAPEATAPEPATTSAVTPSGRHLHALLEDGIAGIARLQDEPAEVTPAHPTPAPTDVVPVDTLLYRGRGALGRALELRDEIRRRQQPPTAEELDELFDLLDLAASA